MKPSEEKQKLVEELASLYEKLDIGRLYGFPSQKDTQQWLAEVVSVLKNLGVESDYQEFVRLSKTVGLSGFREERKNAAREINQFLGRKVAEWRRHDFCSLDENTANSRTSHVGIWNKGKDNVFDSNTFSGLGVGILDEGQNTKAIHNQFNKDVLPSQKSNFGNIEISGGTVVFGNGAKITQVAVKELVEALEEEIQEKVPESEKKQTVLRSLKDITKNETFATVAGTVLGEILRRITRP